MSHDNSTSPFGLWRYGHAYLKAAKTLDDADPNPWVASNVTHQCVCQGIELAFKSFVLAKCQTLSDLRGIGHSLMKCMEAAVDLGLPALPAGDLAAIALMDRYYRENEFRYIVTGLKEYPNLGRLLSAGAWVLYDAAPTVANAMGDLRMVRRMRLDLSATLGQTPHE